jgi:hypothetical protein
MTHCNGNCYAIVNIGGTIIIPMIRTTTLILTVSLNLIMSGIALQAANIQILSLPYTISAPGTYVLTKNLTYSAQQGAAINILTTLAGPVALDFKGHTIAGVGAGNTSFGVEIGGVSEYAENTYPITISNGTVQGFAIGIDAEQGNRANTTELTVKNMQFSTVTTTVATYGVKLLNTSYSSINNCVFTGTEYGINDDVTGGNNKYLNNTFNHVGFLILIGDSDYPLPTITVEECETTVP